MIFTLSHIFYAIVFIFAIIGFYTVVFLGAYLIKGKSEYGRIVYEALDKVSQFLFLWED